MSEKSIVNPKLGFLALIIAVCAFAGYGIPFLLLAVVALFFSNTFFKGDGKSIAQAEEIGYANLIYFLYMFIAKVVIIHSALNAGIDIESSASITNETVNHLGWSFWFAALFYAILRIGQVVLLCICAYKILACKETFVFPFVLRIGKGKVLPEKLAGNSASENNDDDENFKA